MCIAIYKPKGNTISKDTLKNCFDNNPDGSGFMYAQNDKLVVKKGYILY